MPRENHLRIVGGTGAKAPPRPDTVMRRLLVKRLDLQRQLRDVEASLFTHRRRKADERGQLPPVSIDMLAGEAGLPDR